MNPLVPVIASDLVPIYIPGAGAFPGPDSPHLKAGAWYEQWIANDHTVVRGPDGRWHAFGIIGAETESFTKGRGWPFTPSDPPRHSAKPSAADYGRSTRRS